MERYKNKKKLVWIPYNLHKKIKRKACENDTSIENELTKILEKEFGVLGD